MPPREIRPDPPPPPPERPVIEYPIPAKIPGRIKWVRALIVLAGLSSFFSFATAFGMFDALNKELSAAESNAREAVAGMPASAENPAVIGADVLTAAKHFSLTFSGIFALIFLYLPVRYFQLIRRLPKGHPDTYAAIRNVSLIQILVEVIKGATFETINLETAVIKFPTAASPAIFLSVILLWVITRQKSKAFFFRPKLVPVVTDENEER